MTDGLDAHEELLDDPDELWFRHVHPDASVDRDELNQLAFRPNAVDAGKLSGVRSSVQTADAAFRARLERNSKTVGTWAVSVAEIQEVELRCIDDSAIVPDPIGHAYVDMRDLGKERERYVRQALADRANERGRQAP